MQESYKLVSPLWRTFSLTLSFIVFVQFFILVQHPQCVTDREGEFQTQEIVDVGFNLSQPTTFTVFILTTLSMISSGLGGVPFFFFNNLSPVWICFYNSVAAGMMLSASLSLASDALLYGITNALCGLLIGIIFVIISDHYLSGYEDLSVATLQGKDAKKVLLFIGVMTAHSLAEGIGMGMSFGGGSNLGLCVNIAMAIHNLPEGIAVALVLVSKGVSPSTATLWATFSALPQPLMAVPSFWFVESFRVFLPYGLSFSAGAMVWMIFTEMIPEAIEAHSSKKFVALVMSASFIGMEIFQYILEGLL